MDLTPYSPRLLLQWEQEAPSARHRSIDGTLVFADVSGFTRLSERLARARGKAGAEDMVGIIGTLFGDLLTVAALRGGEMLKYGGDAVLLFFRGDDHARRAAAASVEMQARLKEIGRVQIDAGAIRMRMSVGMNSGSFDLFKVGRSHQELVITGPATTETVRMEAAADAGEILLSASSAAALEPGCLGAPKEGGFLLRRAPAAPEIPIVHVDGAAVAERLVSVGLRPHLTSGAVEPEHRLSTVAFVHAMGVDDLIRSDGPGIVADRMHETIGLIQDAFEAFDVTFLATDLAADGTKAMAASGVPIADDDPERRMLLALRRVLDSGTPLPVRAGVNRGHVFAAAVGPPFRQTYTTMGDVTNTAARLCAKAEPGEILVLKEVLDHARDGVVHTERPAFAAKGKSEPLVPYAVEAVIDRRPVGTATALPLVGREVELDCLLTAADAVRAGTGGFVELVGDMGSGKSRLIDELLDRVVDLDRVVAHCEPYERATPFHPVRRLLERVLPDDLALTVEQVAPLLRPWVPLLASVLDVDVPATPETRDLDPKFRLRRTAEVTVELLEALLPDPAVFVVEDLHWLDAASAVVLQHLEAASAKRPWLVVVTRRDEPSTFAASTSTAALVHLAALADADMGALIAAATAEEPLPPHRQQELLERSAGNPLFLTELLSTWGGDAGSPLPDSIEAVMTAQIDRLDPPNRRLLRLAAVLGSRVDLELLAEIAGEPELTWADAAAVANRLDSLVVADGDGQLRFRHQLIRDVAYEALPFNLRRELHHRAGEAIERRCQLDGRERAGILSLHYLHARRFDRCWRYASTAARRAGAKHANHESVQLFERALSVVRHLGDVDRHEVGETWAELADGYELLGSLDRAKDALRRARRLLAGDVMRIAGLSRNEARIAQREAKASQLTRHVRRGLAVLEGHDGVAERTVRAELLYMLAWTRLNQGRPREAVRLAERALEEGRAAGDQRVVAYAYMVLDGADLALGRPVDHERSHEALRIFEEQGELTHQAVLLNTLGAHAYYQGRWTEAVTLYERGRDANLRVGDVTSAATGTFNTAEILLDQGHFEDAERYLDEVTALWRAVTYHLGLASVSVHRGRIAVHRGQTDEALARFDEARATFTRYDLGGYALEVEARTADCLLRVGRIDEARTRIEAALAHATTAGEIRALPRLRRVLGFCHAASGDLEGAWTAMDESLHIARQIGSPFDVALTLEGFATLADVGAPSLPPEWEAEQEAILAELGVVAVPTAPLPAASARRPVATA